ncbi:MAG: DUF1682 domain-containing protein [Desulfobacterales bacterium]|nr:DUF1682 domain-containing protein [Desulfobacterales bacterium]
MKKQENIYNDFFMEEGQEREIRATFGKYHVFEPNEEFFTIMSNLLKDAAEKSEDGSVDGINISTDESELLVDMLHALTDIPDTIVNKETFEKMASRKTTKLLRTIMSEIQDVMTEAYAEVIKKAQKEEQIKANMTPKQRKIYEELQAKKVAELTSVKSDEEIEVEELEKQLAEKRAQLNKK